MAFACFYNSSSSVIIIIFDYQMASKWDDEFDFMDEGDKKKPRNNDPKKAKKNTYGD